MQSSINRLLFRILMPMLLFFVAVFLAFLFEGSYRQFVRHIMLFVSDGKIQFFGKNFHLFPGNAFLAAFGLFVPLYFMTIISIRKGRLRKLMYSICIFLIVSFAIIYFDSSRLLTECTACDDGIRKIHYNHLPYNAYFIISLSVTYLYLVIAFLLERKNSSTSIKSQQRIK